MPLKAPFAYFDNRSESEVWDFLYSLNSLSYASSGDEELVELTANFDDDDDDDYEEESSGFRKGNELIDKEIIEERRRQKENCKMYEVRHHDVVHV